ncbi:MAG: YraN family protein [Streptosporangiaceae bacterium]
MSSQDRTPSPAESQAAVTSAQRRRAEQHLESAGLRILDRDWRCADGQIDIVAAEHRTLVVCEVQTRSASGHLPPVMSRARRNRLRRLAVRWLVAHGLLFDEVRVDVIRLSPGRSGAMAIEHQRGVG